MSVLFPESEDMDRTEWGPQVSPGWGRATLLAPRTASHRGSLGFGLYRGWLARATRELSDPRHWSLVTSLMSPQEAVPKDPPVTSLNPVTHQHVQRREGTSSPGGRGRGFHAGRAHCLCSCPSKAGSWLSG